MKSARDQDIATGIISLGLLANKLAWFLIGGPMAQPALKVDETIFVQWKKVLKETISFIGAAETGTADRQHNSVPHFLSRAQYLEQIYTATPATNRKNLKDLTAYLQTILDTVDKLANKEQLDPANKDRLLSFTKSIIDGSIQEASKFRQASHVRRSPGVPIGLAANA